LHVVVPSEAEGPCFYDKWLVGGEKVLHAALRGLGRDDGKDEEASG
jgi:hypothetical protein